MRQVGIRHLGIRLFVALLVGLGFAGNGLASALCGLPTCGKGSFRTSSTACCPKAPVAKPACCCDMQPAPVPGPVPSKATPGEIPAVLPADTPAIESPAGDATGVCLPALSDVSPPTPSPDSHRDRAPPIS